MERRPGARGRVRDRAGAARARRGGRDRQRRHPRSRGGRGRRGVGPDAGEPRGRRARGTIARAPARLGRRRRASTAVRRCRVRRRHVLVRRHVRAGPPGCGGRAPACVPARRHDRPRELHPGGRRRGVLRRLRSLSARAAAGRPAAGAVGGRGSRPHALRRPGLARARAEDARRAERRRTEDVLRLLPRDVRACRRRVRRRRGGRRGLPRLRDATEPRRARGPSEYRYEYLLVVARKDQDASM